MKIFFYTKHKIHGYEKSNWPYYFRCVDSDYSNTAFILIRKKLEKIFTSIVFMNYHDHDTSFKFFKFNDPADEAAFQLYLDSDMDMDIDI